MTTRYSSVLAKLAKADPRIDEYEYDPGNDMGEHWLHLHWPYGCWGDPSIHEDTVADCLHMLKVVEAPDTGGMILADIESDEPVKWG